MGGSSYDYSMAIRRLSLDEVSRFRAIRLPALRDAPAAFGTTFEEATAWPPEVWRRLFSGLVAFVAVVDDHDVGLVRTAPDPRVASAARLGSLWVTPAARGTGVGASLIDAVVEWARSGGFVEVLLDVSDDNSRAFALYDYRGFVPTGAVSTLPPPREHLGRHQRTLKL